MKTVEWKNILGFRGYYQVSNTGLVRRVTREVLYKNGRTAIHKGRIMRTCDRAGYRGLELSLNNKIYKKHVHRLVAEAFIPCKDTKLQVNHIDGDKCNNHVSNLEWCTPSENAIHAVKHKLTPSGTKNRLSKITTKDVTEIFKLQQEGWSQRKIAKRFGMNQASVWNILHRKSYKYEEKN